MVQVGFLLISLATTPATSVIRIDVNPIVFRGEAIIGIPGPAAPTQISDPIVSPSVDLNNVTNGLIDGSSSERSFQDDAASKAEANFLRVARDIALRAAKQ